VNDDSGAGRAVPVAKAERRFWVPKRSAAADNQAVQTFGSGSQPRAVLCAAKHDEGVYRLHSLTWRQHHERMDVQLRQVSFTVHGEMRHAHQGILEHLEVRRRPSAKALEQPGSFDLGDHRMCFRARDGGSLAA
jgi:hypothetical protein